MQFTKSERSGLKFLFFFAAFISGVIIWFTTFNNVIAFCTIVSFAASVYWFIKALAAPYKYHNKGMKLPPPTFKTTEPPTRPDFNRWISEITNQ